MHVQALRSPADGRLSFTVLGEDDLPVPAIERFLAYLTSTGNSPNTVRAYARDVADLFEWATGVGRDWRMLEIEDIAAWVGWLRLPELARTGVIAVLPSVQPSLSVRTLRRKLAAIDAFFVFHARHDEAVRLRLTSWHPGGRRSYKPFLAHVQKGHWRSEIRLRGEVVTVPSILTNTQVRELRTACRSVRDRFLISLLFETGARIGEALGLRHEDLSIARGEVCIEPRHNDNDARVKNWKPRRVPVNRELFSVYADYMDLEYGAIDSDYVFVNLARGRRGQPLNYSTVRSLALRLRRDTGIAGFTPHLLRHTFATDLIRKGIDWPVLQELLGHASVQTTLGIYGHLTVEDTRNALVAAGRLT